MKLTDAQIGVLHTLHEFGPKSAVEKFLPPAMDGSRKIKLECHIMAYPTLKRLEDAALVSVNRDAVHRPTDAVGRAGNARRSIIIEITDKGRSVLAASVGAQGDG